MLNIRERMVLAAGGLALRGFRERASAFGAGGLEKLPRLNALLSAARASLPAYDAACADAGVGELRSLEDLGRLPVMRRADLAGYAGGGALARLESGGTGNSGRFETRLDLNSVVSRYAALLSVLGTTGWSMGERTAALHPVEYGYMSNLPAMLSGGRFGRIVFEFLQQYVLYRLVHNRRNVYYDRGVFSDENAALRLAESAARRDPVLLISRPDVLMAVLKSLRSPGAPRFGRLKAVLTVGTALAEAVRHEVRARLGVDVFNMYASTELGYVGLSCPYSGEWLHADGAGHMVEAGPGGRLLCTDLDNGLMPLLRYDTGDLGETAERGCLCGRSGRMIKVSGRAGKCVETAEGPLYEAGVIDRVFSSPLPFFQLDPAAGRILLPTGTPAGTAGAIRDRLGLPPSGFSREERGPFLIPPSGKFSFLP